MISYISLKNLKNAPVNQSLNQESLKRTLNYSNKDMNKGNIDVINNDRVSQSIEKSGRKRYQSVVNGNNNSFKNFQKLTYTNNRNNNNLNMKKSSSYD